MSISSIIAAERQRYVSYFEAVVSDFETEAKRFATELLISVNSNKLPYPYRYLRMDVIERKPDEADQIYEVWLDPAQDMEARGFQLGPVTIEIYPFTWCSTQIAFDRPLPDMAALEALIAKWLDVDSASTEARLTSQAIHSASPVETNGELWFLTIDFGTAQADYLLDLIDFLANEGRAERIIITSQAR